MSLATVAHVYTANNQPATRYVDNNLDEPIVFTNHPRRQLYCFLCYRRRWAKNMCVQVYYDCTRVFCKEGHEYYRNRCYTKGTAPWLARRKASKSRPSLVRNRPRTEKTTSSK